MTTEEQIGSILFKVDHILEILQRVESRQIRTTEMVEEIEHIEEHPPEDPFTSKYQKE